MFQSTLPARGATSPQILRRLDFMFQSTLPARGATGIFYDFSSLKKFQSTLPARGATPRIRAVSRGWTGFNPRSPRGERPVYQRKGNVFAMFQSTLPARGATPPLDCISIAFNVSIHAPREGSDLRSEIIGRLQSVSIHAPREGSDVFVAVLVVNVGAFQSTLPARGATKIHKMSLPGGICFNPRSPRGERP